MVSILKIPTVKMKSKVVPTFWYKDIIAKWHESRRNSIEILPYFHIILPYQNLL